MSNFLNDKQSHWDIWARDFRVWQSIIGKTTKLTKHSTNTIKVLVGGRFFSRNESSRYAFKHFVLFHGGSGGRKKSQFMYTKRPRCLSEWKRRKKEIFQNKIYRFAHPPLQLIYIGDFPEPNKIFFLFPTKLKWKTKQNSSEKEKDKKNIFLLFR